MLFVIRKNKSGQYWWRAVGGNGEIMAASELMTAKQSCIDSINVVKAKASSSDIVDRTDEIKERGTV